MNTVVVSTGRRAVLRRYLQTARARHIGVFLEPDARWIQEGDWTVLANFIRSYRHEPAVRAWYLYDEPDHDGLSPASLQHAYRIVKQLDRRPVAVVFMSGLCRFGPGQIDRDYAGAFDMLMFDYYPFWVSDSSQDDLRRILRVDHNCGVTARALHVPFILVLQGFGRGVVEQNVHWRDPSPAELRFSYRAALQSGAAGVFFWAEYKADATTRGTVQQLVRRPDVTSLVRRSTVSTRPARALHH